MLLRTAFSVKKNFQSLYKHYVNNYVNNPTSLQMVRISLIGEKLINKITVEISFGKLFNFNILIMI